MGARLVGGRGDPKHSRLECGINGRTCVGALEIRQCGETETGVNSANPNREH
jgi:hypothetical protein